MEIEMSHSFPIFIAIWFTIYNKTGLSKRWKMSLRRGKLENLIRDYFMVFGKSDLGDAFWHLIKISFRNQLMALVFIHRRNKILWIRQIHFATNMLMTEIGDKKIMLVTSIGSWWQVNIINLASISKIGHQHK